MNANKGMYAEEIFIRTINYLNEKNLAYFEKRFIPIKIIKNINNKTILGSLIAKSTADFSGVFNKRHLEIEVKQTDEDFFLIKNIKKHQINFLLNIQEHGVFSFILLCFYKKNIFVLLTIDSIYEFIKNKKKRISFEEAIKKGIQLEIEYPGILNIYNFLKLKIF